jgi:hypothetical protein
LRKVLDCHLFVTVTANPPVSLVFMPSPLLQR